MSRCDNCGRSMGHSDQEKGEYLIEDIPEEHKDRIASGKTIEKFFGDTTCKDIFEEELEVVEKIQCHECDKVVKKSESVESTKLANGAIKVKVEYCPECAKADANRNSGENE